MEVSSVITLHVLRMGTSNTKNKLSHHNIKILCVRFVSHIAIFMMIDLLEQFDIAFFAMARSLLISQYCYVWHNKCSMFILVQHFKSHQWRAFVSHPFMIFIYTPKHCSWLNEIGNWIKNRKLYSISSETQTFFY